MEYKVQIDDNSYVVEIEEMTVSNALNKTAEDIAYSAFLSEYDHCVQRSEKLDNKVYILLTVCAFLFVLLTSVISEAGKFRFPENGVVYAAPKTAAARSQNRTLAAHEPQ